jgi:hypothetical protein
MLMRKVMKLLFLVTKPCFLVLPAADQVKKACVRLMAAEIGSVKHGPTKQHLLSLPITQDREQRGKEKQQQQQECMEQALAEDKQSKEGCDPDDPGNVLYVQAWHSIH